MTISTTLNQICDLGGRVANSDALSFSSQNQYFTLTTGTVTTVTVPTGPSLNYYAQFKYKGCSPYVLPTSTPTLTAPDATVTNTLACIAPTMRNVRAGQTLQFLTEEDNAVMAVSISYYTPIING